MTDDRWTGGTTYESFMGRWSRKLAPRFVSWLQTPAGAHWLDVGCGTGALADTVCRDADPASVLGCDPAEPFITYAREYVRHPCLSFAVAGVGSLPAREGGYGSVTSMLALNFFPDPVGAVREMASLVRPGAGVSACVWDYAEGMELLRRFWDAAVALDPAARDLDEGRRFPICRRDALIDVFRRAGLSEVRCDAIEVPTPFASFDDFWRPYLGGTGPAPAYLASIDSRRRDALAEELDRTLPRAGDGTIPLSARAWAVRGAASGAIT
jgi:SAM-dependent methyltransferase